MSKHKEALEWISRQVGDSFDEPLDTDNVFLLALFDKLRAIKDRCDEALKHCDHMDSRDEAHAAIAKAKGA